MAGVLMGTRWRFGRRVINLNEGGRIATFYWNGSLRLIRVWVKPSFWRAGRGAEWNWTY